MATYVVASRPPERRPTATPTAGANVEDRTGSSLLQFRQIDLQSFSSVRKFALNIIEKEQKLDILVFCSCQEVADQKLSEDGQELVFQVNHLSPFLMTNILLGTLKASESSR